MDINTFKNFSGNISEIFPPIADDYHRHAAGRIIGVLITVLIAITSIIGNVAVVIASFNDEVLRAQIGNLLIVYLSSVDILTAIFVMIPSAISVGYDYWPLGDGMCKVHALLNYLFACSSSVNLAVISVDRAIAIAYPFQYRAKMSSRTMYKLCVFIFIVSFIVASTCALPDWTSFNYSEATCAMEYTIGGDGMFYAYNLGCATCYYMPVIVLSISNTIIIITARRAAKSRRTLFIRRDNVDTSLNESVERENHMRKTIKTLAAIVVTYYVCFTPYAIIKQVKVFLEIDMSPQLNYFSTVLIYIASATNPFIYAILRKDYRNAFIRLFNLFIRRFFP